MQFITSKTNAIARRGITTKKRLQSTKTKKLAINLMFSSGNYKQKPMNILLAKVTICEENTKLPLIHMHFCDENTELPLIHMLIRNSKASKAVCITQVQQKMEGVSLHFPVMLQCGSSAPKLRNHAIISWGKPLLEKEQYIKQCVTKAQMQRAILFH